MMKLRSLGFSVALDFENLKKFKSEEDPKHIGISSDLYISQYFYLFLSITLFIICPFDWMGRDNV